MMKSSIVKILIFLLLSMSAPLNMNNFTLHDLHSEKGIFELILDKINFSSKRTFGNLIEL